MSRFWLFPEHGAAYPDDAVSDEGKANARPVVVIDPEDADQAERLLRLYNAGTHEDQEPEWITAMQAALRKFATPTPPEPAGLAAVIEDADGKRWVKVDTGMDRPSWTESDSGMAGIATWRKYAGLDVARVLSEGVPS